MTERLPVLFIVGPTASGKSKLAMQLAASLDGEIISADSMQVYKGMDIGTAKPSRADQKKIPHHLIDLFKPSRNFSVFEYRKRAIKTIEQIAKRGKLPIVVGGTGFYVRALLEGLETQPPANPKLRRQLEKEAKQKGLAVLYQRLQKINPQRAAQIKPQDQKRIIRALEIASALSLRGRDIPCHREAAEGSRGDLQPRRLLRPLRGLAMTALVDLGYEPVVIGITRDRQELYRIIEKRVDQMFRKGLATEVKKLMKGKLSRTARQAVGYKEMIAALQAQISLKEAKELIKKNTRHLAKRQWTWFKREKDIQWITLTPPENKNKIPLR